MATSAPSFALVVVYPFGDYQRGTKITDQKEIDAILKGENARSCVKTRP